MRLDEIKARAAAATEGPWVNDSTEIGRPFPGTDTIDVWVAESCHPNGDGIDGEADAEFIAHARSDVPRLVAALESVLELHQPYITRSAWQTCNECWNSGTAEGHNYEIDVRLSSASVDPVTGFVLDIVYPCPTVAAIQAALGEGEK